MTEILIILATIGGLAASVLLGYIIATSFMEARWRRQISRWEASKQPPRSMTLQEKIAALEPESERKETAA